MPSRSTSGIGARIAALRHGRHFTQADLARAAKVSLGMVRAIEQGVRNPSDDVLEAIARPLGVDPVRLTGTAAVTDSRVHAAVPEIRQVIDAYDIPDDGPTRPLDELAGLLEIAVQRRLSSQYSALVRDIPALIAELTRSVHIHTGPERRRAAALLAAAYRSADGPAYKYGYHDLSARLVELMRWAAGIADDPLLDAAAAYVRTETFFASRNLSPALRSLQAAIDRAPAPDRPGTAAAVGALHMRAAVVAGRLGDREAAHAHIGEATALADRAPEGVYHGTAFGPASARVHAVSVAVELGDGPSALRAASEWAPPHDLPAERRSHYYIDVARAQMWQGLRDDALESLQVARKIAPQHVREHPHVRETLATLVRLHRQSPGTLLGYAEWARAL